jgi:hypothetical protein
MTPTDRGLFAGLLTFAIVVPLTILYALLVSDHMGLLMFDGGDAALAAKLSLAGIGLALCSCRPSWLPWWYATALSRGSRTSRRSR